MRKLLLICGVCVLISGTAFSQKTDRERDGLKGPVKMVRVRQAAILSEDAKESESPLLLTHEVTYDQSRNRTALALYDRTGSLSRRIEYQYDPATKQRSGLTTYNSQNAMSGRWPTNTAAMDLRSIRRYRTSMKMERSSKRLSLLSVRSVS